MISKKRVYAWLLSLVMLITLVANQYMVVVNAEETVPTLEEVSQLSTIDELPGDGSNVKLSSTEVMKVRLPYLDYSDWSTGEPALKYNESEVLVKKFDIDAGASVCINVEYVGDIDTLGNQQLSTSFQIYSDVNADTMTGGMVNNYDYTKSECTVQNYDVEAKTNYICFYNSEIVDDIQVSVEKPVAIDRDNASDVAQILEFGDNKITGDIGFYHHTIDTSYLMNSSRGPVFSYKVPDGENYMLNVEYVGNTPNYDSWSVYTYEISPYGKDKDRFAGQVYFSDEGQTSASVFLESDTEYIFFMDYTGGNSLNFSDIKVTISDVSLIDELVEEAEDITGKASVTFDYGEGKYAAKKDDSAVVSRGKLTKVTLQPYEVLSLDYPWEYTANCYTYQYNRLNYESYYSYSKNIVNDTDEEKTYYIWFYTSLGESTTCQSNLSYADTIYALMDDKAVDISKFDTYTGSFESEKYAYITWQGYDVVLGKLFKITVEPGEMVDIAIDPNIDGMLYDYTDGKLSANTYVSVEQRVYNQTEEPKTYYMWLRQPTWNDTVTTYSLTTAKTKTLSDESGKAAELKDGSNLLDMNQGVVDACGISRWWNEYLQKFEIINIDRKGYLYKYTLPAMSQITVTLKNANVQMYNGIDIYENISSYPSGNIKNGNALLEKSTISNISDKTKDIYFFIPEDELGMNLSGGIALDIESDTLLPKQGVLTIYSWNDEVASTVDTFLEKYPEYSEKIRFINLDCSGIEDYPDKVRTLLDKTSDGTAIIAMDVDVLDVLKGEEGFSNIEDIGLDMKLYDNAYDFTFELGSVDGEVKALAYKIEPGHFLYNENIAMEVLGTKDPKEVQEMISTPEKFLEVAELMQDNGYYMTSGADIITNTIKGNTFNPAETKALYDELVYGEYTTGNNAFSSAWMNTDMFSENVFGFFSANWFLYWVYQHSDIPVNICEGPIYYPWGGTFLGVSSTHKDAETDAIAALFLETICCDEEVMYNYTLKNPSYVPNNMNVVDKIIENDVCRFDEIPDNPFVVYDKVAYKIMKGEWESKCIDGKFIICVDENNQIDLSSDSRLALAGFVYSNLTEVTDNATLENGILTVKDLDKVVKYEYVETGVLSGEKQTCYLQFIPCQVDEEQLNTVTKLFSEGTEIKKNGETVTGYVQVTNGEISGQIDEVDVETNDNSTTINITENRDATGQIVKDASLNVGQDTISEDTLNQSIDVAVNKTKEYQEKEESTAEIVEIKAEFNDDTSNTKLSKDFFNKLGYSEISLEISKKNGEELEYMWYFDKDSIRDMNKDELKDVNTKLTIHKENTYKDEKDLEKLTKDDAINCVLEFSHEGKLPGETTVTANVGNKYKDGETVYYYHYNPDTNAMLYVGKSVVVDSQIPVAIDHCSDYVITNKYVDSYQGDVMTTETTESVGTTEVSDITTATDSSKNDNANVDGPGTGDGAPIVEMIFVMILSMTAFGLMLRKKYK